MANEGDAAVGEQTTFGDFVLGLEGLAILRAWMADSDIVTARRQKILEMAEQFADEPWSNPLFAEEKMSHPGIPSGRTRMTWAGIPC